MNTIVAFAGSNRFELMSKLGEGGMGIVYEARDRQRNLHVALKTLRHMEAASLYRFKREFRAVSDLSHPNIVTLYELVADDDTWFFTMEMVRGRNIVDHVRVLPAVHDAPTPAFELDDPDAETGLGAKVYGRRPTGVDPPAVAEIVDLDRLRSAFGQLARALHALHQAGLVHRDLKPSNVQVTDAGRVVLMDFGIVAEQSRLDAGARSKRTVGTPAYMAPEQITGDPPSAAADWYAFGVMLYVALTGALPFTGTVREIVHAKLRTAPDPIEDLVRDVPAELQRLCMRLLDRRPRRRPAPQQVLATLGIDPAEVVREVGGGDVFVGRVRELGVMSRALEAARRGIGVSVLVIGDSGMGKSTLVRHFLDTLPAPPESGALVLTGRCHERESLSFNAFDGVIDSLSHALGDLPERVAEELMPGDMGLVTRLFPVLRQVPALENASHDIELDPRELRERAARALRQLLAALAAHRPVILYIDDLQWADRDSLELLIEIMSGAAGVMLLGTLRSGDTRRGVWEALEAACARSQSHRIQLGPLSATERHDLLERLIARHPAAASLREADVAWSESDASPLLMVELARFLDEAGGERGAEALELDELIGKRIGRLAEPARRLLEAVAVAGEPTPCWILSEAAALGAEDGQNGLMLLRASRLIRITRPGADPWITTHHARVHDAVITRLGRAERTRLHARMATALESWGQASVDALARHWREAGDGDRARAYLVTAARDAEAKLAFDRAAELYRAAIELGGADSGELLRSLGDTLRLAGRSYEAAAAYERAALTAGREDALDLRRMAADEWMRSGHIQRGIDRLAEVMSELGASYARSRAGALLELFVQRMRLKLRGLGYTPRPAGEIAPEALSRIDSLYAAATSLGIIDHLRGVAVQTCHLMSALDAGEEQRVCRALALEHALRRSAGRGSAAATAALGDESLAMARRLGDPYLLGVVQVCRGGAMYFSGHSAEAVHTLIEADNHLRSTRRPVEWERRTAHYLLSLSRITTGHLGAALRGDEHHAVEAERRNDVYTRTMFLSIPGTWSLLSADRPDEAERRLDTALQGWPDDSSFVAGYVQAMGRALVRLYRGDGPGALEIMDREVPHVRRLMLHRVPWVWAEITTLMGRAALLSPDSRVARRRARAAIAEVRGTGMEHTRGLARMLRAGLRRRAGDLVGAQRDLQAARERLARLAAHHLVAACDMRLGVLLGGDSGALVIERGRHGLIACGVQDPARMLELLAPGFSDA